MSDATSSTEASRELDTAAVEGWLRRAGRKVQPTPWLHAEVGRRMAEKLPMIRSQPARVLDWWSVLGGARELLQQQYPQARFSAWEPTPELARHSARGPQRPWWSPARWKRAALPVFGPQAQPAEGSADLLWANMMLHWSPDPPAQLEQWQRLLAVDGFVMFSCFGPDTLRELRALYAARGWGAATPAFIDMHDIGDMMVHAGFADPVMDMETITLSWDSAPRLLAELRTLGVNAHPGRRPGLRTPRWRARLEAALAEAPRMSFEIVYGHAFKAAPRIRVTPETRVSLGDMRGMLQDRDKPVR
ncbi:methyltransferase domain-containing protein [Caldimonas tepidiphila]|uniref:methyltransferase domain-containing protein n=1 Tax=Caldimonas tepidiphila TaxID=2315841 RepID=UPI000E5C0AB4|nr:methyltransferase domain-containing protein [Caldimonas tepidiphila]